MADYTQLTLNGEDIVLQANMGTDDDPDFRLVICQTDGTISLSRASIDAASKCNPTATKPGNATGTTDVTVQDLVGVTDGTVLTNKEMFLLYKEGKIIQWRLLENEGAAGAQRFTFHGWISTHNKTMSTGNIVTTANTITLTDEVVLEENQGTTDVPNWVEPTLTFTT